MPMAEVEQFSYGVTNPILASVMAYVGCLLGLACTAHARTLANTKQRTRWLLGGSVAIGGAGIWLMHMMAMLGFEVEGSPMRFNPWLITASLGIAIAVVTSGIFLVGYGPRSVPRLLVGGVLTGIGVSAQHLTGMAAVHINGSLSLDPRLLGASIGISVVASTTALWFTLAARHGVQFLGAAAIMAVAVTGMHYTAMAALRVDVDQMPHMVRGVDPTTFVLPILLMSIATAVCLLFCALNVMGDEDFRLRADSVLLGAPSAAEAGSRRPRAMQRTSSNGPPPARRPTGAVARQGGPPAQRTAHHRAPEPTPPAGELPARPQFNGPYGARRPDRANPSHMLRALSLGTHEVPVVSSQPDQVQPAAQADRPDRDTSQRRPG